MGVSRNPYMTGSEKSAANMTWRQLLGQQVFQKIRAKGMSNPSAEVIQAQLTSAGLWLWSRWMSALIKYGWTTSERRQGRKQSWYAKAFKTMLTPLPAPSGEDLDPAIAYFSNGTMSQTLYTAVADASAGTLALTWDNSLIGFGKRNTDRLVFGWYNNAATDPDIIGFSSLDVAERQDGTAGLSFGANIWDAGDLLDIYVCFVQAEDETGPIEPGTGIASKSVRITTVVVA